jgi:hypothetical protein
MLHTIILAIIDYRYLGMQNRFGDKTSMRWAAYVTCMGEMINMYKIVAREL